MLVTLHLKEDMNIEEDSITITVIKKSKDHRAQSVNAKKLDDLTAVEQQAMKALIATVEKYRTDESGATDIKYSL